MDMITPPFVDFPPTQLAEAMKEAPPGSEMRLRISGVDAVGSPREFVTLLAVPEGATGQERIEKAGLELLVQGDEVTIDNVAFGSPAQKAGLEFDQKILKVRAPADQPPKELMFIPALLLLAGIVFLQRMRRPRKGAEQPA
jgi:hypothetical protein